IGSYGCNCNPNDSPKQCQIRSGVNELQVGRATDELTWMAPRALEKNRHDLANARRIEPRLLSVEQLLQAVQPVDLDAIRHLIAHRCTRCSRARAVLERVGLRKTH